MLLWIGATSAFRFYVSHVANYASTYGSLSAVIVLLLWLMMSAYILLLGAKLNAEAMAAARPRRA
nr:YhjD/YihY/BrkB family envelope integrity protein [Sphingomonas sp. H160509]